MICAARTGSFFIGGLKFDGFRLSSPVDVGTKLLTLCDTADGSDDTISDDEGPNVLPLALRHELLEQHLLFGGVQGFHDGFSDLDLVGEDHPDTLGAFEEFDDHRSAADADEGVLHIAFVINVGRGRDADIVAGKDLKRAKLVTGIADPGGGVRGEHVHLLELPDDRGAVTGDRSPDPREDGVRDPDGLAMVVEIGIALIEADRQAERVQDFDVVPAIGSGFDKAVGRIALR